MTKKELKVQKALGTLKEYPVAIQLTIPEQKTQTIYLTVEAGSVKDAKIEAKKFFKHSCKVYVYND